MRITRSMARHASLQWIMRNQVILRRGMYETIPQIIEEETRMKTMLRITLLASALCFAASQAQADITIGVESTGS